MYKMHKSLFMLFILTNHQNRVASYLIKGTAKLNKTPKYNSLGKGQKTKGSQDIKSQRAIEIECIA